MNFFDHTYLRNDVNYRTYLCGTKIMLFPYTTAYMIFSNGVIVGRGGLIKIRSKWFRSQNACRNRFSETNIFYKWLVS